MRISVVLLIAFTLFLVGCNKVETEDRLPQLLNVELEISPKTAKVNEVVTFQAKVTYGNEVVTDADDVSFEIWQEDQDESETFVASHSKDGLYVIEKRFKQEGTYYVYAHVTAKSMHTMPKEKFNIGTSAINEK